MRFRIYPCIPEWSTKVALRVTDERITPDVLREAFKIAGDRVGVGRFRPYDGGAYGRFELVSLEKVTG